MNTMLTRAAGLTALLCAVALTLAGCGASPPPAAAPENVAPAGTVTEYVGTLDGVDPAARPAQPGAYFLAIAVDGAGAVTGYMCDGSNFGDGTPETFSGRLAGDRLDLTSDTGRATLTATRSGAMLAGEVRLGDQTRPFTLTQAQGVGGLYLVTRAGDVSRGESERGNRFEAGAALYSDPGVTTVMVATTGGETLPLRFDRALASPEVFSQVQLIALDSGDYRGNRTKFAKRGSGGEGFTDPFLPTI